MTTPDGRQEARRWCFTPKPGDAGDRPLRIEWRNPDGTLHQAAETTVRIAPPPSPRPLSIMIVGDSLTDGTDYPNRLVGLLLQDGFAVTFIGSHSGAGRPAAPGKVLLEGRGGWRYLDYVGRWTDADDYRGKSPFLASPDKIDFQAYLDRRNHGRAPDVITVMLGVNDIAFTTDANIRPTLERIDRSFDALIAGFRAAAPNALIGIALPPPAGQDAFGLCYGTKLRGAQYRRNLFRYWNFIVQKCAGDPRLSLIPVHLGLDTENHYPTAMRPVADGSSVQRPVQTNALHPNADGYRQIGDSFYCWLRNQLR